MSQQVNLLNTALIRPRDWLSPRNIGLIYLVAVVLMYGLYMRTTAEVQALAQQREAELATLEGLRAELAVLANQKNGAPNSQEQELQLQQLLQKKEAQAKLLATFQHLQGESGHHILDYMIGFASQTMQGVWITGFKLNGFEQQISVTGRALSADQVPAYIEHLGAHHVFKGKLFSGLTLKEVTLNEAVTSTDSATVTPAKLPQVALSADKPSADPAGVLKLIEFDVKGQGVSGGKVGADEVTSQSNAGGAP